ncbi:hypothetical protein [Thaumasiovibrio sp. DFM-14]|uniref:hypothetical protein n=1 Tax=Thaumasiovibrio sp. DFM-14 TaxID=3384792 RepID=UPI00399FD7E2
MALFDTTPPDSYPCIKASVKATVIGVSGNSYVGTNFLPERPTTCPRYGFQTGLGYEICRDGCGLCGTATFHALTLAGGDADGGTLILEGHWHLGKDDKMMIQDYGIQEVLFQ